MDDKDKAPAESLRPGYGNPPVSGRFKPGQSGNPAGRPKGSGVFREALRQAALEETTNEEQMGKKRQGTTLQLLLHDRFHRALHLGNQKAATEVLRLARLLDDDAE